MKITPPKGRPMLYWVNKKPIESIKGYPAQLVEVYDPFNNTKFYEIPKYEYLEKDWHNLLFEGDNKEVLATLLELGFRGRIDLIYIDPPFASNKDYVRKVELRGFDGSQIQEDDAPLLQQVMYEDIWKRDEYFQWIYERLILMKELLSEKGSIYVHLDYRVVHYVKLIMDEIFGEDNFVNEIVWGYRTGGTNSEKGFARKHDTLLLYSKTDKYIFNIQYYLSLQKYKYGFGKKHGYELIEQDGHYYKKAICRDIWDDIEALGTQGKPNDPRNGFYTQKPEALLERIIKASSNEGSIVLDCFIGSGTTARVAQKLGRRWIGIDINKGAIQLTVRELRRRIEKQIKDNGKLFEKYNKKYFTFAIYKVNDYDLKMFQSESKSLAIEYLGIERTRTDAFFDGKLGNKLVKIIDFSHPLTLYDLELLEREIKSRNNEERNIVVVSYGRELSTYKWVEEWNKKIPINKIEVIDLRTDKEKGGLMIYSPPQAKVTIRRIDKEKAQIVIEEFISPTVIKRFNLNQGAVKKVITDFKSMIDYIEIDTNYNGKVFRSVFVDIPEKKEIIKGEYEIKISPKKTNVAIKIVDVLGGECIVEKEIKKG